MLLRGLPEDAITHTAPGKDRWGSTQELLAQLIEEISVSNVEPRQVRERPVHVRRPWDDLADLAERHAAPPPSDDPVVGPDGGVTAVGAIAAMKAMSGASIRHVPDPVPAPAVEGVSEQ